jgi:hypothetical protein
VSKRRPTQDSSRQLLQTVTVQNIKIVQNIRTIAFYVFLINIFWNMALCSLVNSARRFRKNLPPPYLEIKMEAVGSSETSVITWRTTRRHFSEDRNIDISYTFRFCRKSHGFCTLPRRPGQLIKTKEISRISALNRLCNLTEKHVPRWRHFSRNTLLST